MDDKVGYLSCVIPGLTRHPATVCQRRGRSLLQSRNWPCWTPYLVRVTECGCCGGA